MKTTKFTFSFKVRHAMQVAMAVAEERENTRPVLLGIRGAVPTFHFEGGTVVKVHMVDLDQFTESWRTPHRQDWVVTHCEVRYYPVECASRREKVSEVWEADKLLALKSARPWWHPHVRDRRKIMGFVGVFINNAAGEGYLSVDPERNQEGHFTLYNSVEYARFVEGDLERAKVEALKILDGHLAVNAVAVFYNGPSGEAYWVDGPTGNYRGSGHYPFSYMGEYEYDPDDPDSRAEAIRKAEAEVRNLTA